MNSPHVTPLVFLHGFLGSGENWRGIIEGLQGTHQCIPYDLPGHGKNIEGDIQAPLSFDTVSQWLADQLDKIPASKINLVGYSLGGRVALHFATHYPERIQCLILESANPGIMEEEERNLRLAEDTSRAASILKDGMSVFVDNWYQTPLFASLKNHPETRSTIIKAAKRNQPRWMAKSIRELSPGLQPPLWDLLSNLSFPVLLITGEEDRKYAQVIQKMAERIPNSASVIVENAGHNVHAEQAEKYIAFLKGFLDRCASMSSREPARK